MVMIEHLHDFWLSCLLPLLYFQPFPSSLYNLLEQSLPFYDLLKRYVRQTTPKSLHPHLPVPANEKLLAWVGDEIFPRESAKVQYYEIKDDKFHH